MDAHKEYTKSDQLNASKLVNKDGILMTSTQFKEYHGGQCLAEEGTKSELMLKYQLRKTRKVIKNYQRRTKTQKNQPKEESELQERM